jgi:hypothetical protein
MQKTGPAQVAQVKWRKLLYTYFFFGLKNVFSTNLFFKILPVPPVPAKNNLYLSLS